MGERFVAGGDRLGELDRSTRIARVDRRRGELPPRQGGTRRAEHCGAPAGATGGLRERARGGRGGRPTYRDIVMRQKTIKGFFIAPKATYVAKEAEGEARFEAQLAQLGVSVYVFAG